MPLSVVPFIIPLPFLLVLSALFSGAETALFGMSISERLRLRRTHPRAGAAVDRLLASPRALLVTVLLANMTINVLYFVLASVILLQADNPWVGVAFNLAALAAIVLVGEVLAKLGAGSQRLRFCTAFAGLLLWVHRGVAPLRGVLEVVLVGPLTRLIRPAPPGPRPLTIEELSLLLELGTSEGAFDPDEERLLARVVEMGVVRVREIMTPRVELASIETDDSPAEILRIIGEHALTEIPVHTGRLDRGAIGFLDVKRYLGAGARAKVESFLKPAKYVPEQATLDRALAQLHAHGAGQALCVDEHGTVVGLIAIEDIVDSLLEGPEADARGTGMGEIRAVGLGRFEVPGRLGVREWASLFGGRIDPRVSTVGGLIVAMLGRIPHIGDSVSIGNVHLEVIEMAGARVQRAIVSLSEGGDE